MHGITIIGAGARVQNCVLPAITLLGSSVHLQDIYSKTKKEILLPDGNALTTRTDLKNITLDQTDVLIVVIPARAISKILMSLKEIRVRKNIAMLLDTPPGRFSHLWRTGQFKGYRSVGVGEDWVRLAPIVAARNLISKGKIGELKSIQLFNSGYRYHALAAIKTLCGVRTIQSIRYSHYAANFSDWDIKIKKGIRCRNFAPNNYEVGRIAIIGTKGSITDYSLNESCSNAFQITYPEPVGCYQPVLLNGEQTHKDEIDARMSEMPIQHLIDSSRINLMKINSYARILQETLDGNKPVPYPVADAMYDYFAATIAEKVGRFRDITFRSGQQSLLYKYFSKAK
jgi:hypothetical protein